MRRNPERLAWTVLGISLLICVTLAISVPLAIRSFINDTADISRIKLEVQQGTVLVRRLSTDDPIGVTTQLDNLLEGTTIRADENVQALLTIESPNNGATLMIVQIYGSTNLAITLARSPRFQASGLPHREILTIDGGRLRVTVSPDIARPTDVRIISPQATTVLHEGSGSIDVTNDELQVTVHDGTADVTALGATVTLTQSQRTQVVLGQPPTGALSPERNLIVNGNFRDSLDGTWEISNDLQEPNESPGSVSILAESGRRLAVFDRSGVYHAETDLKQVIDKDVRDFRSLKLHFVVEVSNQDVPVCGQAGSECPLMLKLDYKDSNGTDRSYIQGFYYKPDDNNVNPNYCTSCGSRVEHIRVPQNFPYTYDFPGDLITLLQPAQITAITFYASGHSYRSVVAEIELLGEQ
jgi:hypothetical protein